MRRARLPQIAFCGPGEATPEVLALAHEIGRLVAVRGATLVCGGLGGAMAAACEGAREGDGATIGILPGYDSRAANQWVTQVVCTGMGQARNVVVVASADAMIAVGGGFGTLSEIALALRLHRPVVLVGGWDMLFGGQLELPVPETQPMRPIVVQTAEEAVSAAFAAIAERD